MVEQKRQAVDFGILLGWLTRASSISCAPISRGAASTIWAGLMDMSSGPWPRRSRASASWRDGCRSPTRGWPKIIAEMVERRYVERKPDPDDSRVKRLRLGPRGRAALAAARRFHRAFERELGRSLGKPPFASCAGCSSGSSSAPAITLPPRAPPPNLMIVRGLAAKRRPSGRRPCSPPSSDQRTSCTPGSATGGRRQSESGAFRRRSVPSTRASSRRRRPPAR